MNRINREKLRLSKWTAVAPINKRRHFIVNEVIRDDTDPVVECILQAVFDHREYRLAWCNLTNDAHWLTGWR